MFVPHFLLLEGRCWNHGKGLETRARLSAQGRDSAGIGRSRVTSVVRESGVRGVRRGGTSVTARPARGAGGGPGLVGRGFEAGAPGPAARGRHRLRAHGQRLVRLHGVRRRRVRPRDRRPGVRRRHGHQGAGAAGAGTGGIMGPPRMAAWTVSRAVPAMARGASASCTPPGSGNAACLPRPAWPATRTAAPWPRAPTARTGPGSSGDASPSGIRGTWNRRRSGGSRGGDSKRPHRPSGHRTPERTEPSIM